MSGTKNKAKPSTMVPIMDCSSNDVKPKKTLAKWSPSQKNTEVGLEAELRCGDGQGFDQLHEFYLNMESQLRLCMNSTLGRKFAIDWADVSIGDKHEIISSTKQEYPYLFRFVNDWGVEAMFKKVLRNACNTKNNKQNCRKGGNKAHARKAPNQNIDEDNDNVAEAPPPKQCCHDPFNVMTYVYHESHISQ
ncbi:hypothetical protein FRC10_001649 [Ceratobasidium sp. 414]|nr:hypothetical protein FRC10_001649 [Ceratobasidium sp. 414]